MLRKRRPTTRPRSLKVRANCVEQINQRLAEEAPDQIEARHLVGPPEARDQARHSEELLVAAAHVHLHGAGDDLGGRPVEAAMCWQWYQMLLSR